MKTILNLTLNKVENGYVLTFNSFGASKQFISPDFAGVKKTLADFVDAIEEPQDKPVK